MSISRTWCQCGEFVLECEKRVVIYYHPHHRMTTPIMLHLRPIMLHLRPIMLHLRCEQIDMYVKYYMSITAHSRITHKRTMSMSWYLYTYRGRSIDRPLVHIKPRRVWLIGTMSLRRVPWYSRRPKYWFMTDIYNGLSSRVLFCCYSCYMNNSSGIVRQICILQKC